eukprot:GHVU01017456.1.p2 GENE.GHVU01017456.1~~GHVU01017456.1.p2  ORF type:complete len:132 (-),score=2.39 GHVU01017456.1:5-400(-)
MTPKIWRPIGAAVCILCWTVYRLRSASDALLPQSSAPTVRGSLPALDVPLYPAGDDMPKLLENATLPEYLEKHAQRIRGDMVSERLTSPNECGVAAGACRWVAGTASPLDPQRELPRGDRAREWHHQRIPS